MGYMMGYPITIAHAHVYPGRPPDPRALPWALPVCPCLFPSFIDKKGPKVKGVLKS
jgi:hypothetical protein